MKTLVVTDISRSIDLMDRFVDEDYDYLELQNWFTVVESQATEFSLFDNSTRLQVSLMVAKGCDFEKPLCEYEPTMTEIRQMRHSRFLYLDYNYPDGTFYSIIRDACKTWKKNVFIPLETEICLRAQTSDNRMDYGCEWLGGGDWEEKTLYGDTTDFFIVGIILHEAYKYVHQDALEIYTDLKHQHDELSEKLTKMISVLKNTEDEVIHHCLGRKPRTGKIIDFSDDKIVVQFESSTSKFIFPDCFFKGFLENSKYSSLLNEAYKIYLEVEEGAKNLAKWKSAIDDGDVDAMFDLVHQHQKK